jgi:outer membrane protein OmpA-like peptidoglycan-associated protein
MNRSYVFIMLMAFSIFTMPSCNTSNAAKGAVIGAGAGAATGAILAKNNKAVAIIFGAAIGGLAGGLIGDYMDKQAAKIQEDLKGAKVERVGEGILITFDSGILFDIDSYMLRPETQTNAKKLASTLNKYNDTDVHVLGHTDNTGTDKYNLALSKKRANAIKSYMVDQNVAGSRMDIQGLGESDPLATNETADGRQLNRRVEIVIVANEKLKKAAKKGDLVGN